MQPVSHFIGFQVPANHKTNQPTIEQKKYKHTKNPLLYPFATQGSETELCVLHKPNGADESFLIRGLIISGIKCSQVVFNGRCEFVSQSMYLTVLMFWYQKNHWPQLRDYINYTDKGISSGNTTMGFFPGSWWLSELSF